VAKPKQKQQDRPTGYGYDYISQPAYGDRSARGPAARGRMSALQRFLRYGIVGLINRDTTPDPMSRLQNLVRLFIGLFVICIAIWMVAFVANFAGPTYATWLVIILLLLLVSIRLVWRGMR